MTDHFRNIYATQATPYDRMVSREDQRGNLFAAINEIIPLSDIDVVDFGTGTGRITRLLSVLVRHIYAFDISHHMLVEANHSLEQTGMTNWSLAVADNGRMPAGNSVADLAIEGWSFGHVAGWYPDRWRGETTRMLQEMERILKPGGTAILLETMGTGNKTPQPPTEGLAELYAFWQEEYGFNYRWIRTDYQFESVAEADELTRFFFGDELANWIVAEQITILPECTGIWWKQF